MMRRRPMIRTVTPGILARWLEVKHLTVLEWIRHKDPNLRLPAMNIATRGRYARYIIFRKDLITFLKRRGMTEERITELLGRQS